MKKAIVSAVLVFSFAAYALAKNFGGPDDGAAPLIPPTTTTVSTPPPSSVASAPPPTPTTPTPSPAPAPKPVGQYKDGSYIGSSANAYYGTIQVEAIISGGKITDVQFLQYPSDRSYSQMVNGQAMPYLTQEAIAAQSANVNIVSGATDSSMAFRQSLAVALASAKN